MNDEAKTEEDHKKSWKEKLTDAALEVNEFCIGVRAITGAIREQAPKAIDDIADVIIHGYKRADEVRELEYKRLMHLVHGLTKDEPIDSEHAAGLAREVLRLDVEQERIWIEGATRVGSNLIETLVSKVIPDAVEGIVNGVLGSDKLEDVIMEAFRGSVCEEPMPPGVSLDDLSEMAKAGAFGVGDDGKPKEPTSDWDYEWLDEDDKSDNALARCKKCHKTFAPALRHLICPHEPLKAPEED